MDRQTSTPFGSILFVSTGQRADPEAFERAIRTSLRSNARLTVARVINHPNPEIVQLLASSGAATETLNGNDAERADVEALVDSARGRNIHATSRILRGDAAIELIRLVLREDHDVLFKAAEPATGVRDVLFGHVDRQLMRNCPCPVWIDKPASAPSYRRILAAVDPNPFEEDAERDPVRQELNGRILELAISLARCEEAELHVVHAWFFDLEGTLRARAGLSPESIAEIARSIGRSHESALRTLLAPYAAKIAKTHLLKGRPWDVIHQVAVRQAADLLVMGTVGRTGISGLLIGNTAETVLDQVDCSLLTLKPPGFVSPVHES